MTDQTCQSIRELLVDYADIMKPERRLGEMRHEQAGIYEDLRQMAGIFNVALWTASQAPRGALDKAVLDIGDFAEAYEKAAIMDAGVAFCLLGSQSVVTDMGSVKISGLKKLMKLGPVNALSHNFETGEDEWRPILNWWNNGRQGAEGFLRVHTTGVGNARAVTTPDHEYFRADGSKVFARRLRVGDKIMARGYVFSESQRQVLLGSLLGDGYVNKDGRLRFEHGAAQLRYLRWKLKAFGSLSSPVRPRDLSDGWGKRRSYQAYIRTTVALKAAHHCWYANGWKQIPDGALDTLSDLGLAVWFMDDATVSKRDGRITLFCQGFDSACRRKMYVYFASRGWSGKESRCTYQFDAASSRLILKALSTYFVPSTESRETKRWVMSGIEQGRVGACPVVVCKILPFHPKGSRSRYDIEVAHNHNFYLASGLLVSNCQSPDERLKSECRLALIGLRSAEDMRMILCEISRKKCFLRTKGLIDPGYVPIPTPLDREEDQEAVMQTTVTLHKAVDGFKKKGGGIEGKVSSAITKGKEKGVKKKPSKQVDQGG